MADKKRKPRQNKIINRSKKQKKTRKSSIKTWLFTPLLILAVLAVITNIINNLFHIIWISELLLEPKYGKKKTAAFSLGKKLTVVTKSEFAVSNASWDLDQIPEIGWNLIIREESEISEFSSQMGAQGTIVVIENLDRVIDIDDEKKAKNKFYRIASKTEKHLALTFHRFIEEDNLILELNGTLIKAWNPFILENSATQELPEESIFSDDGSAEVIIQPYVLPHKTKFVSDDDYQAAGGSKGWNYHQGIYVYRNRRLIICGTWFDYIKKEPAYNLARIKIDITPASDEDWKIDIKKSTASLPSYVRESVEREIDLCTETSARVYNSRGSYSKSNVSAPNLDYVWEQRKKNGRYSFHINRKHSLLNNIKNQLDDQGKENQGGAIGPGQFIEKPNQPGERDTDIVSDG